MFNSVNSLGYIQAGKPNFGIPFNAFTANSFKDNHRVVNSCASSKTNLIHRLFCFQQGLQTMMKHPALRIVFHCKRKPNKYVDKEGHI